MARRTVRKIEMRAVDVPAPAPERETGWAAASMLTGRLYGTDGYDGGNIFVFVEESAAVEFAAMLYQAKPIKVYRDTLEPVETSP